MVNGNTKDKHEKRKLTQAVVDMTKDAKGRFLRTMAVATLASAAVFTPKAKAQQGTGPDTSSNIVTECGGGQSVSYINSYIPFILTPPLAEMYPYYGGWGYGWGYPWDGPSITAMNIEEETAIMDVRGRRSRNAESNNKIVNNAVDDAIHAVLRTGRLGKQVVESRNSRLTVDVENANGMVENPQNGKTYPVINSISIIGKVNVSEATDCGRGAYAMEVNQEYIEAGYGNNQFVVQRPNLGN